MHAFSDGIQRQGLTQRFFRPIEIIRDGQDQTQKLKSLGVERIQYGRLPGSRFHRLRIGATGGAEIEPHGDERVRKSGLHNRQSGRDRNRALRARQSVLEGPARRPGFGQVDVAQGQQGPRLE